MTFALLFPIDLLTIVLVSALSCFDIVSTMWQPQLPACNGNTVIKSWAQGARSLYSQPGLGASGSIKDLHGHSRISARDTCLIQLAPSQIRALAERANDTYAKYVHDSSKLVVCSLSHDNP